MIEVSQILYVFDQGDPHAASQLLRLAPDALHRLAAPTFKIWPPWTTFRDSAGLAVNLRNAP